MHIPSILQDHITILTHCPVFFWGFYLQTVNAVLKCAGVKTQSDSMSQNTRKALSRNQGTPTETPPSTLVTNSKGLNPSPKRAVRDPKTGRGTAPFCLNWFYCIFTGHHLLPDVIVFRNQKDPAFNCFRSSSSECEVSCLNFSLLKLSKRETRMQWACGREWRPSWRGETWIRAEGWQSLSR